MSHRVDASVDRAQSAGGDPVLDRVLSEAELVKLTPGNDSVLSLREPTDLGVPSSLTLGLSPSPREVAYTTMFRGLGGHFASVPGSGSHLVRGLCQLSVGGGA